MDDETENQFLTAEDERFKTALHHTVGKLCNEFNAQRACPDDVDVPPSFSKSFIASLTEVVCFIQEHWANDLEAFAKHAKRTTVNVEDVRLLTRRSPSLIRLLDTAVGVSAVSDDVNKPKRGRKPKSDVIDNADNSEIQEFDRSKETPSNTNKSGRSFKPIATINDSDNDGDDNIQELEQPNRSIRGNSGSTSFRDSLLQDQLEDIEFDDDW